MQPETLLAYALKEALRLKDLETNKAVLKESVRKREQQRLQQLSHIDKDSPTVLKD